MFNTSIKWLRKHGWIGSFFANLIQFITFYPGLTMSALITVLLAKCTSAIEWVQQPFVYSFAGILLFLLWTYIGLEILRARKQTQTIRIAHDYAYSLIVDGGWQPIIGKFPKNHPTDPEGDAVQLACNFRNVGAGPLRLKVEECRVVLNGRTCDELDTPLTMTFARMAPKGIRSGAIKRDAGEKTLSGNASFKFIYGPPDGDYVRLYILKLKINIFIDSTTQPGVLLGNIADEIVEEKDEPYVTR